MSYVGNNFGTGSMKCNSLCKYFVGVLNKETKMMEIHDAELFNLQPYFPGEAFDEEMSSEKKEQSYREKVDFLIESFGTKKQKRALNSRRMHDVVSGTIQNVVAKAAEHAIEKKGVTALLDDVAQSESQDISVHLPVINTDAECREEVYSFDELISPAEYAALETASETFRDITSEDIQNMIEKKRYSCFVVEKLKSMPQGEKQRDHIARCLWYLDNLIRLNFQKQIKSKFGLGENIPHVIIMKLLKNFTVVNYSSGSVKNMVSTSMKVKIAAHVIALALHIEDFQTDLTVLQRDLKLTETRFLEIARAMRLKITKAKVPVPDAEPEIHKIGSLSLPLPSYEPSTKLNKRKRMS
ncbi:DNA-directed RNA polymerase I subunit RPA49 isoform X2 [Protopterus annectens]|nr:DNA-directed RNA polymerase I subunit RPA49 isoform X2 [Protopterus annectens]